MVYRALGLRACLELNPFRSIQLGSRPSYPITVSQSDQSRQTLPEFLLIHRSPWVKNPSIKKWRIGWRFNAQDAPQYEVAVEKVGTTGTYPGKSIRNVEYIIEE